MALPSTLRGVLALLCAVGALPAWSAEAPFFVGRARPPEQVQRVVTLAPSLTETVLALGAGATLVGVSRFDTAAKVRALPRVGGFNDPSVEAVLALQPHVVLVQPSPGNRKAVEKMAALGVPVLALPLHTVASTVAAQRAVGEVLGREREAEAWVRRFEQARARVRAASQGKVRPRVLLVYGFRPLVVAGPESFAHELIADAGGVNAAADTDGAYVVYSVERAVRARPDVVVDASDAEGDPGLLRELPGLKEARWVKPPTLDLLHPGPALASGLEQLAALVHPPPSDEAGR